jgi:hypothetical protein
MIGGQATRHRTEKQNPSEAYEKNDTHSNHLRLNGDQRCFWAAHTIN